MAFWNKWFKNKTPVKANKVSGIMIGGYTETQFPKQDYLKQIEEVWKCVVAFKCIDYISKSCSQVGWKFIRVVGEKEEVVDDPDLNRLLKRPNPGQSFSKFIYNTVAYLLCNGNSYPLRIRTITGKQSEIPKELYILRPDLTKIKTNKEGNIVTYVYKENTPDEKKYDVDPATGHSDVLHLKEFNPTDELYGSARTQTAAYEIDTQNQATLWNFKILKNEARLGMLYLFKGILDQSTYDLIEEQIKSFSGAENAGKSLILQSEQGVDAKPYNWSPKDIDFLEGGRETARKICNAYGVPPMLLGIPGDNTYSNQKEARLSFWEETVIFYINYITEEFNNWCFSDSDIKLKSVLDEVPAFIEKRMEKWEKVDKLTSLTVNEKRKIMGLDPVEGGDSVLVSAGLLPIGSEPEDLEETITNTANKMKRAGYEAQEINNLIGADEW